VESLPGQSEIDFIFDHSETNTSVSDAFFAFRNSGGAYAAPFDLETFDRELDSVAARRRSLDGPPHGSTLRQRGLDGPV
jgi:hypothetical protein